MLTGIPVGKSNGAGGVGSQNSAIAAIQYAGLIAIHVFDVGVFPDEFLVHPADFLGSFGHFPLQNIIDAPKNNDQNRHNGQPDGQILKICFVIIRRIIDRLPEPFIIDSIIGTICFDFPQAFVKFQQELGIAASNSQAITFRVYDATDALNRIHGPKAL